MTMIDRRGGILVGGFYGGKKQNLCALADMQINYLNLKLS